MRAQEKMGHSAMSEGWRNHTSSAQERVNWVMDEVMSGRMGQADGMVEMERAQEMMREERRINQRDRRRDWLVATFSERPDLWWPEEKAGPANCIRSRRNQGESLSLYSNRLMLLYLVWPQKL